MPALIWRLKFAFALLPRGPKTKLNCETNSISRVVGRRMPLRQPASGANGGGQATCECSATGKPLELQSECKRLFGSTRAVVCFADIHRGSRHTAPGGSIQLRGSADWFFVGRLQSERREKVGVGRDTDDWRSIWKCECGGAGTGMYRHLQKVGTV